MAKPLSFGVYAPIIQTMTIENMNAAAAGTTPPNLIDFGFTSVFLEIGGGGCVLGLAICFIFLPKVINIKTLDESRAFQLSLGSMNQSLLGRRFV